MKKTIAGFFDSSRHASAAIDDLLLHGYNHGQINVLMGATDNAEQGALIEGFASVLEGELGISHEHAQIYLDGMRRGGTLLLVSAPDEQEPEILALMDRHGAAEPGERVRDERAAVLEAPAAERVVIQVAEQATGPLASALGGAFGEATPAEDAEFAERATIPEGNIKTRAEPMPAGRESGRTLPAPRDKPRSHP